MIKAVLLNRLTDGLIFCQNNEGYTDQSMQDLKSKIKKHHKQVTAYSKDSSTNIKQIQNNEYAIYYKVDGFVVFTVIAQNGYPPKLVNSFIDTIARCFFDEAKCILGAQNLRSRLQSIEGTHYFAKYKFDRIIRQKQKQYQDPSSTKNTDRLKKELESIHQIMKVSMNQLQSRHNDLLATEQRAINLNKQAQKFHTGTKKLVWNLWIKKNLIWLVLLLFAVILYFCIF